jgi:chromosome segregation ATPase
MRRRSPSPGARAPSSERATVDPVLARYHAIKRELDANRGTPARAIDKHAVITPETRAALRSPAPTSRAARPSSGVGTVDTLRKQLDEQRSEAAATQRALEESRAQNLALARSLRHRDTTVEDNVQHEKMRELTQSLGILERNNAELAAQAQLLSERLDAEAVRRRKLEAALATREERLAELQSAAVARDREMSEQRVSVSSQAQTESVLRRHVAELEQKCAAFNEQLRHADMAHHEYMRHHALALHEKDLAIVAAEERANEVEHRRQRLLQQDEALQQRVVRGDKDTRDLRDKYESLCAAHAEQQILYDQLQHDGAERQKLVAELRSELAQQISARDGLEAALVVARDDVKGRDALQQQLTAQSATIDRLSLDLQRRQQEVEQWQLKYRDADSRAHQIDDATKKASEAEALASGRLLTIEKLRNSLTDAKDAEAALQRTVEDTRRQLAVAESAAEQQRSRAEDLEHEVARLHEDTAVIAEIHGKLRELNDAIDERNAVINRLQLDNHSAYKQAEALQSDLHVLQQFKAAANDLEVAHEKLADEFQVVDTALREANSRIRDLEQDAQRRSEELNRKHDAMRQYEAELAHLVSRVADHEQLENRLRQSQAATQQRAEELLTERDRSAELVQRLKEKEAQYVEERQRRVDQEKRLADLLEKTGTLQVDAGRLSVAHEVAEKDRQRLEKEVIHRTQLADARAAEMARLQHVVEELEDELTAKQRQVAELRGQADEAQRRAAEVTEQLHQARAHSQELQAQLHRSHSELASTRQQLQEADREVQALVQLETMYQQCETENATLRSRSSHLSEQVDVLQRDSATHATLQKRCAELEQRVTKSRELTANLEADNAAAARKLVEKERELGRIRERNASLGAELETAESRITVCDERIRTLESERERFSKLDGQLSGLAVVAQQRARDLEESREQVAHLRSVLRETERAALQRGSEATQSLVRDLESKVAARSELVSKLEAELQLRNHKLESQRDDFSRLEMQLRQREQDHERLRDENILLHGETDKLRREIAELAGARSHISETHAARWEMETARLRDDNLRLAADLQRTRRELDSAVARLDGSRRSCSVSNGLEVELRRTKAALDATVQEKQSKDEELQRQADELEVATANIQTLQERLRSTPMATWRNRRAELAQLDAERAREYDATVRAASSPRVDSSMRM